MTELGAHRPVGYQGDGRAFRSVGGKVVEIDPGGEWNEQNDWETAQLAYRLIGIALHFLPRSSRTRFRAEWLAELDEMKRQGIAQFRPALRILRGAPVQGQALRAATRRRIRATAALPPAIGPRTWLVALEPNIERAERIPTPPHAEGGDVVALRDADGLLGTATVEVSSDSGVYPACPHCRSRSFDNRSQRVPKYRCHDCHQGFDHPRGIEVRYGSDRWIDWHTWTDLPGLLSTDNLEGLRIGLRTRGSVVELHSDAFRNALGAAREAKSARALRYRPATPATERTAPLCNETIP